jgi:hypothetical protein
LCLIPITLNIFLISKHIINNSKERKYHEKQERKKDEKEVKEKKERKDKLTNCICFNIQLKVQSLK